MSEKADIGDLPKSLQRFIADHAEAWNTYTKLGEICTKSGPLEEKYLHFIKIAIFAVRKQETAFKTHVRHALRCRASQKEIEHALLQLLTAEGIGTTMIAWNWATQVIEDEKQRH